MQNKRYNSGFTLLEMIVSLGIFTIVAVIAVGSLVRITSLNRQAQSMQAAMNNTNYILESISREMRFSKKFHCVPNDNSYNPGNTNGNLSFQECNAGQGLNGKGLVFMTPKQDPNDTNCYLINAYWFVSGGNQTMTIKKSQQNACGERLGSDTATEMIDTGNVTLQTADFTVSKPAGGEYALTWIHLAGYSGAKEKEKNYFDIKTAVSQRIKD
jgi:prepilin-type N-terminal cleavage/methylation domain-containing protein